MLINTIIYNLVLLKNDIIELDLIGSSATKE